MSASRLLLPSLLGAVTLAASTLSGFSAASAQIYVRTWNERFTLPLYGPGPRYRIEEDARLHPREIVDELEDRGFRDLVVVARRPDIYVIEATNPRRAPVRLVIDAYDGEILRSEPRSRSEARVIGEPRNPAISSQIAALPTPPQRRAPLPEATLPRAAPPKVAGPVPEVNGLPAARPAAPGATAARPMPRPPSADWNPINSVPVAPLL